MVGFVSPMLHQFFVVSNVPDPCFKTRKTNFALNFEPLFSTLRQYLPPPIVISYRFLYFYLIFTPNPRINLIQILIMKENKELYDAPTLTVVELKQEGVICASGDPIPYSNPFGDELTW
jgi:hypothetical protein